MAIYHNSIRVLSSSSGRSAVQFSAYMSGDVLENERTGERYDHTSKEEIVYSEMMFADCVPEELRSQKAFWNEVEKYESQKSSKAQFSRTFELALPKEFSDEENIELAKRYAASLLGDGHPAVQIAIHHKENDENVHAHIMVPIRQMDENGKWKSKEVKGYVYENENGDRQILTASEGKELNPDEWKRVPILDENGNQKMDSRNRLQWERAYKEENRFNSREMIHTWRTRWADITNEEIQSHNLEYSTDINLISEKTLKAQGIDRIATVHEGYAARKMEQDGLISEVCEKNRQIKLQNELSMEIKSLEMNIIEQQRFIDKLKAEFEKFMEGMRYGLHSAAERLRSLIEPSIEHNRAITEPSISADSRDIKAEIEHRRSIVRESGIDRAGRDAEWERQRIEASRIAEERELRRKISISHSGIGLGD